MLISTIETTIEKNNLIKKGKNYGVAVSGGMDSMFLLNALLCLREKFSFSVIVLHYEHGIRGENSVGDMQFVKNYCSERDIPFRVEQGKVLEISKENRANVEDTARKLRYDFFYRVMREENLEGIMVAHHKNDSVETFLLNLLRGSGLNGLKRMKYTDGNIIRPLLDITREDIEKYVVDNNIPYVYDQTNSDLNYSRNYIRKIVIPEFEHINSGALENIYKTSGMISDEQEYLITKNAEMYEKCICMRDDTSIKVSLNSYSALSEFEQRDFLRYAINSLLGNLKDISYDTIEYIRKLAGRHNTGKSIDLPQNLHASISYDLLIISTEMYKIKRNGLKMNLDNYRLSLDSVESVDFSDIQKESMIQYIDGDKLPSDYIVRYRQNGDFFRPLGVDGRKKLKDWFIDNKIPREERDIQPLLCSGSEILWIIGKSLGNSLKIDKNTKNFIRIAFEEK